MFSTPYVSRNVICPSPANASPAQIMPGVEQSEKSIDRMAYVRELDPAITIVLINAAGPDYFLAVHCDEGLKEATRTRKSYLLVKPSSSTARTFTFLPVLGTLHAPYPVMELDSRPRRGVMRVAENQFSDVEFRYV